MKWLFLFVAVVGLAQPITHPPAVLPAAAVRVLRASLEAARAHDRHVWRDTAPINGDGSVNAYIEIPKGDRRKYEFDMRHQRRAIDRVMPRALAYPVNYGFVPQTVSYDGDPFDALVLGPPLPGGRLVRGIAVGILHMEDEKGLDSKIVLVPVDGAGAARPMLTPRERDRLAAYFAGYKRHEPGKLSRVLGWGDEALGLAFLTTTQAFFEQCRAEASDCVVARR